jgi:hypothetical protein
MTADARYARRAATRLNALLDEEGFPYDALGRSRAVADRIGAGMQAAQQLLSGLVPWSWNQVDTVCSVFQRPPGYFFDPVVSEPLPSDARLVTSSDGGESIVWRSPHGFLRHAPAPGARLRYLTMRHQVARYPLGSLLVYAEEVFGAQGPRPRPGDAYVVGRGDRLEVMQCQCARDTLASFEPLDQQGISVVVPLDPPAGESQGRIAGGVFAAISAS